MGIPYSREINSAFEQVTPLVAAGFKVLRTTKNISILLAVIQVLTVFFLLLILLALLLLLYTVNPDLEKERKVIVTPFLQWLARVSFWGVIKGAVSALVGIALTLGVSWYLFLVKHEDVEYAGNEDADKALEEMEGDGKKKAKEKAKAEKGKKNGKDEGKEEKK
ncbi:hypothetical protein BU26DRAFT_538971 [Trematosphaeria pertusa]|uniref:Uncharacterized protein n=1 Tax=Trematosphaeria pertusa TaxID=390896 RepID=A0A6A6IPA0_9PLEO|nr:uncharacterized protein BU26DRAFT_538971 [Trematosphaeria pertusa]KAF2252226.1 hypothetical protein BU26DRAFT_538971 [Trematosphaeria pertusa]